MNPEQNLQRLQTLQKILKYATGALSTLITTLIVHFSGGGVINVAVEGIMGLISNIIDWCSENIDDRWRMVLRLLQGLLLLAPLAIGRIYNNKPNRLQ